MNDCREENLVDGSRNDGKAGFSSSPNDLNEKKDNCEKILVPKKIPLIKKILFDQVPFRP